MNDYTIRLQVNPAHSTIPEFYQSGFFFNEPSHLQQQRDGQFYLVTAINQATRQVEARCAFFVDANEAVSPGAAPFGSIEFAETLPNEILDNFIDTLIHTVQEMAAPILRLINYPHCYAPRQASRLTEKLFEYGFRLLKAHQTFFLPIRDQPFERTIEPEQRRRLRKCREAGFQCGHWVLPDLDQTIDFLKTTRRQQGYHLTICPERLADLLHAFPDQFLVFAVTDGPVLAALSVAVRVRHDILYHFMPASHPNYGTFSPMVMLTDGLYTYCQQQGIRLLDLGVSLDNDQQPKPSLMRFKRNIGAQESAKLVFEKRF